VIRRCQIFIAAFMCLSATCVQAAPGDILFQDNLNNNLNQWSVFSFGGDASIGNETSASGRSMRLRWDTVVAITDPFNAAVPGADFTVWVRRGSDAFSEDPDTGEDLYIQYLNNVGTWVTLEIFPGAGTPGEIFNRSYTLPPDALHAALQLRIVLINGNGSDFDYWHVDDVVVTETAPVVSNCDDFESGFNWTAAGPGSAGVSGQTFNSPGNSMFLRWDTVTATSPVTNHASSGALDITVWVRRGDDSFSEDPDGGEDLVFEYLNNVGTWITLETFTGNGGAGQIYNRNYTLPVDALHANFQMRFRYLQGNGADFDYWHVDDVCQVIPTPSTDHFDINHDTTAINCQAEPVTIEAHNADHSISTGYTGTLNLSTSTGNGDWSVITGAGVLNNGAADDGAASYTMVAGDLGVVVLGLKDTTVETLNINVTDGIISELTGSALASEDQDLAFAQSGFVFLADGVASSIGTQIGDKASSLAPGNQLLELQAIRTSDTTGACEAALQGVNQIELAFECRNPTTCTANLVNIDGGTATNIAGNPLAAVATYTPVNLDFGDVTDTTASFVMNYPDVGEIQLYARYNIPLDDGSSTPSGIFMSGSSNNFVVRPFGFNVVAVGNPAAVGPGGAQFTTAGSDFTVTSTAVLYQAGDDANSDGIPDNHTDTDPANNASLSDNTVALNYGQETATEGLTLTGLLNQPVAGNDPGLLGTNTITSFINGAGSTVAARYDEVGIIEISANVTDGDYLGIGLPATTSLLGKSGYVGRFYPGNFAVNNPVVTNRVALACAPASSFTYMGENYRISYDLGVWSADPAGPAVPVMTQNYVGAFAKLDPSVLANMNYGATDSATNYTARLSVGSAGVFAAGMAPITATLALTRNATPDGAYPNFEVGIVPADSDGVSLLPAALDLSLDGGPNTHGLLGQTDIRYGRLNIQNNFGSELLQLNVPLLSQYYLDAAAEFVTNSDDSCTSIAVADVLLYNDQEPKVGRALGNSVITVNGASSTTLQSISAFVAGKASMLFSSPGAEGYVDIEVQTPSYLLSDLDGIDHGIEGPGMHCNPALNSTGDPGEITSPVNCAADLNLIDDIPLGRGTFGIFKGSDNIIYLREVVP
jgi:hypothetical protein